MVAKYDFFSRMLHGLALGNRSIAEVSFSVEQSIGKFNPALVFHLRHVFISGLARAGTTILMRRFYSTGLFRSLTYRDMPFVLMPNLWHKLSGVSRKNIGPTERAHGDGIFIDFDSPEALDEVFWRVFCGDSYIFDDHLGPMVASQEDIERFRRYVAAVLRARETCELRYLSKNNNNVLRLQVICDAFPNALIIVPFRDPVQHAFSLLRQHRRFVTDQAGDAFVRRYMTWLCHHEFGSDHRPFRFEADIIPHKQDSIDYWLFIWHDVYRYLERTMPEGAIFLAYETLCRQTAAVWTRLQQLADITPNAANVFEPLNLRIRQTDQITDVVLLEKCNVLYARMVERMNADLITQPEKI